MTIPLVTSTTNFSDLKAGSTMSAPEFVSSDAVFEFVDELPASPRGNTPKFLAFADALRENPGRWAAFPVEAKSASLASSRASNLKNGRVAGFSAGDFDAVVRGGRVFVRFIGGQA